MFKKWTQGLQNWLTLLGLGLTAFLVIQLLEFPFHREFWKFRSLYLPLMLLTTVMYALFGVATLSGVFLGLNHNLKKFSRLNKFNFPIFLSLWFIFVFIFQRWMVKKAGLHVSSHYYLALVVFFVSYAALTRFKRVRQVLAVTGIVILVVASSYRAIRFATPRWQAKAKGPNVLLVVADTLRRDHTSIYGYERDTTPFLKTLADDGMVFDDVLSTSAWTKPAMASMLTSRYLEQDRVLIGPLPIEWSGMRLPEFFYRSGYDTALITANPNTGSYIETTQGYQWITQATPPRHFALQNFVIPKLFQSYLRMKDWLKYRNTEDHLDDLMAQLDIQSLSDLSKFEYGQLQSDKISKDEHPAYQRSVGQAIRDFSLANIRVKKMYPLWRLRMLIPWGDPIYRSVLKYCFITLYGADGELANSWINDIRVTRSFKNWFDNERDTSRPFFAHLQYMGPHTPYKEQPPYMLSHFDSDSPIDVEGPPSQHTLPSQGARTMTPEGLFNMISNYNDSIRITDANIRMVADFLKERGEWDNTIIAFVSDHGEAFYEHGIYGHMYSLHAEMVNVPLFFHYPPKIKPGRNTLPASIVDVFPTFIELADLSQFRKKAGDLEGLPLISMQGELADAQEMANRKRWATTRVSAKANPKQRGQKKQRKKQKSRRKKPDPNDAKDVDQKMNPQKRGQKKRAKGKNKIEAIHRMVAYKGHKLVEERENDKSTLFLYDLKDWREPRNPVNPEDNEDIAILLKSLRPLPKEYEDINEPEIDHQTDEHKRVGHP